MLCTQVLYTSYYFAVTKILGGGQNSADTENPVADTGKKGLLFHMLQVQAQSEVKPLQNC